MYMHMCTCTSMQVEINLADCRFADKYLAISLVALAYAEKGLIMVVQAKSCIMYFISMNSTSTCPCFSSNTSSIYIHVHVAMSVCYVSILYYIHVGVVGTLLMRHIYTTSPEEILDTTSLSTSTCCI